MTQHQMRSSLRVDVEDGGAFIVKLLTQRLHLEEVFGFRDNGAVEQVRVHVSVTHMI